MTTLLDQIKDPETLKTVHISYLPALANEIREDLLRTISGTGGHLSSNLGAVELTIAIHYVFDSPTDKIVWDVGHQSYTHKLLTGRRDQFSTLRQLGGLSGFVKRGESPHDITSTGHAGTALSTALGIAKGRDHEGEAYHVVSIVGDGGLPNGMTMEALNNVASTKTRLIIILNDNDWSISKAPGSLAFCLTTARSKILSSDFFKEFGLKYFGPVDGHNVELLVEILREAKEFESPVVLHVVTQKGKGYAPAMSNPCTYHGISLFDIKTGKAIKEEGPPSYMSVFAKTLCELAEQDRKIVVITAGMPDGTGVKTFAEQFPERFYDVGIAEEHAVTFAGGLAVSRQKPVVAIYSTFLQRAYDQIVHDVCLQNLPVTFAIDRAGLTGEDGPTHHGTFDYAYLRHIPNMVVMAPKDENELRHMLKTAIEHQGPSALRYPRGQGIGIPLDKEIRTLPVGKGEILVEGKDVVILAIGNMVHPSLEAAERLKTYGLSVRVINARFVKPLDTELVLDTARNFTYWVTVEDHAKICGFGSAVLECLANHGIHYIDVMILGLPDKFIEHGNCELLREQCGLKGEQIEKAIKKRWFSHRNRIIPFREKDILKLENMETKT